MKLKSQSKFSKPKFLKTHFDHQFLTMPLFQKVELMIFIIDSHDSLRIEHRCSKALIRKMRFFDYSFA